MNPTIRKIAEQAGFDFDYQQDDYENCERFALLLIEECLEAVRNDISEEYTENSPYYEGWARGQIDACHAIKYNLGLTDHKPN